MEAKSGRTFVDPRIDLEGPTRPWLSLTDSERALAEALFHGSAIKRVALDSGMHCSTVYSLRSRLLRKLGLRSDTDLVHYIYRNGLARFLE
jgi:DNA-binding NarL/FixJ family response regulator